MKNSDLKKYFNEIKEKTGGDNSSDSDILDYKNGYSIDINEIEKEYYNYKELEQDIDDYIDENNLDSVKDEKNIKEHFTNIDENLFLFNQGFLKDFADYMSTKINKLN